MAVTDLHSLDISTPINKLFATSATIPGAVLSLVQNTPQVSIGSNTPLVISGRAKGSLRHEGQSKVDNGRVVTPRPFTTAKLIYSQRVTDEFMTWTEQAQADYVSQLVSDWTTKSMPRDIDTVVFHGKDPYSGADDPLLSDFMRKPGSSIIIPKTGDSGAQIDADFKSATEALEGVNITGLAISGKAASELSTVTVGKKVKYPELGIFGLTGGTLGGKQAASSPEVGEYAGTNVVIGDWSNLLLGFAGTATWRTYDSGNPDNVFDEDDKPVDLGGVNMVCIRMELNFGFRILDSNSFAVVCTPAGS